MRQEAKTPADARVLQTKHVFVGSVRIASKKGYGTVNSGYERNQTYSYHGDHLGSAQLISNYAGNLHERIEYTPYSESWVEHKYPDHESTFMPFRFTGKELDEETGLYYYGARYLDPKTSRWISGDPALGDYVPGAPVNDEARERNGSLPGMGRLQSC
jgi:RHS repeat-associated protein